MLDAGEQGVLLVTLGTITELGRAFCVILQLEAFLVMLKVSSFPYVNEISMAADFHICL